VALYLLAIVAVISVVGSFQRHPAFNDPFQRVLAPLMAVGLCSLLIWRLWQRPRKWGLGIGIFLLLMLVFQTWLMALAVGNPNLPKILGGHPALLFTLNEFPIAAAAVACLILRFVYPPE
jgi:hypothetical protein